MALDANGVELKVGDKVRAVCDIICLGFEGVQIEENDLMVIEGIKDDYLSFTTFPEHKATYSEDFVKVDENKTEKDLLDEDIKFEQEKIKKLHNEINSRIEIISEKQAHIFEIDDVAIEFTVDKDGIAHSGDWEDTLSPKEKICFCCGNKNIEKFIDGRTGTIYFCPDCISNLPDGEETLIELLHEIDLELGIYAEGGN